jgi:FAD synthetase
MPAPLLAESDSCIVDQPASPLVADSPLPSPDVCAKIYERINAFLAEEPDSQRLKSLQKQTRISLDVISEALDRYRYASVMLDSAEEV